MTDEENGGRQPDSNEQGRQQGPNDQRRQQGPNDQGRQQGPNDQGRQQGPNDQRRQQGPNDQGRQQGPNDQGRQLGPNEQFCPSCGAVIKREAEICPECGVRQSAPNSGTSNKDRTTAGILAILLGGIGAHKFYLNETGLGILYLCFSWTFIPAIIGLIEGIIYLTKTDQEFEQQYAN